MAIARIKKIHITGHNSVKEGIIELLHQRGAVQINDLRQEVKDERYFENSGNKKKSGEDKVLKISFIMKFLERFGMKTSMMKIMSDGKALVTASRLEEVISKIDLDDFYAKCRELEKAIRDVEKSRVKAYEHIEQLKPWVSIKVKLSALKDTGRTRVMIGAVALKNLDEMMKELTGNHGIEAGEVSRDSRTGYLFIVFLKEIDSVVGEMLRKYEFNQVSLSSEDLMPEAGINQIENSIKKFDSQEEELTQRAAGLTSNKQYLNILYDHYVNYSDKENVGDLMAGTASSFLLSGWIEGKKADKIKSELENKFREVEVSLADPEKNEQVPIVLENNRIAGPLEFVTDLYGRPKYSGIDPTPYFTPFFLLFFAICITDAGYGIMLSLASLFVLKKYKMGSRGTHFWKLGLYGGIMTIVIGAITGGWFGNTIDMMPWFPWLKDAKNFFMRFDPMKYSMEFLYFSLILGYIQVLTGIAVKFYMDIRDGDVQAALYDELPWFVLLICVVLLAIPGLAPVGKVMVGLCLLVVLLFNGRKSKNIFGRIATGAYRIYGGIDYLKDILSYSRLFALGLGTSIMAMAVNNMVKLMPRGTVLGVIAMAVIFIGGHTFNFIMNLLSAYVHTSRLQYVEFFTKFYESGGKEFKPFAENRKFTEVSQV